ncbi:MAG: hypothetical protein KME09_00215 [Pleurocapsa minor HA4230-MV1]|nr:hypothetical protein [Pleurocapsa minor HA4230-MV1]
MSSQKPKKKIGNLLADEAAESFDRLDRFADEIKSNSSQIDGLDLISLGIKSVSGIGKIGSAAFKPGAKLQNSIEDSQAAEEIYSHFHRYFKVLDELNKHSESNSYLVESKRWGKVVISNTAEAREIKIGDRYHAVAKHNEQWQMLKNDLTNQDIDYINKLPKDKKSLVKQQSGNLLAEHLLEGFKTQDKIFWKFNLDKFEESFYEFKSFFSQHNILSITGKDRNGLNVYKAKIHSNGLVEIEKNEISITNLKNFVAWKQKQPIQRVKEIQNNLQQKI